MSIWVHTPEINHRTREAPWLRSLLVGAVVEDVGEYCNTLTLRTPDGKRYLFSAGGWEYEMDLDQL